MGGDGRRGEAEAVGEGCRGGGFVQGREDGGPAPSQESYEGVGGVVRRFGPQTADAPGGVGERGLPGGSKELTTSGQMKTLGTRIRPWPARSRSCRPFHSMASVWERQPNRRSISGSSPPRPTSASRREWNATSASSRARSRGQSGSTSACQAVSIRSASSWIMRIGSFNSGRPRDDSRAPGVSASDLAVSSRAASGSAARTAAISSSKVAAGPIGGGQSQSGQ